MNSDSHKQNTNLFVEINKNTQKPMPKIIDCTKSRNLVDESKEINLSNAVKNACKLLFCKIKFIFSFNDQAQTFDKQSE